MPQSHETRNGRQRTGENAEEQDKNRIVNALIHIGREHDWFARTQQSHNLSGARRALDHLCAKSAALSPGQVAQPGI
jgi:hypothetical protein